MDTERLQQRSDYEWEIAPDDDMKVPAILFADESLIHAMDNKVYEQIRNVTMLPGIVGHAYAMPDAHWGYGFPIGGVAAMDPEQGGVVSAGGVGFDISCGVRTLLTHLTVDDILPVQHQLADLLYYTIPAGLGSQGELSLNDREMTAMLKKGAIWAVEKGYGDRADLSFIEENGCMADAKPEHVSTQARKRQHKEMGTLGSGNHYLEVQKVVTIYDTTVADTFGLRENDVVVSIHCGSRGLGHQIGTEFLRRMVTCANRYGINLPDRELACAPIYSDEGRAYLGAMRAAINCALANRQILTHLTRRTFFEILPEADLELLYDVSHNTCKLEQHFANGKKRAVYVHRKGATRAFGPDHPDIPEVYQQTGQPVLIGGSMGTASYILTGTSENEKKSLSSACHGAGRKMSRRQAHKKWRGHSVIETLEQQGILIRSPSYRGVAEEAPGAYKDVSEVITVAHTAGLAKKVAKLEPMICING